MFRKSLHFIYAGRSHVKKLKAKLSVFLSILAVFSNSENSVNGQILQGLSTSVGPIHLDEADLLGLSKSKVQAEVTLEEITPDFEPLPNCTCLQPSISLWRPQPLNSNLCLTA